MSMPSQYLYLIRGKTGKCQNFKISNRGNSIQNLFYHTSIVTDHIALTTDPLYLSKFRSTFTFFEQFSSIIGLPSLS